MNTEDKIAELNAEIARLTKTIAWYQGQAGQRIGEAARAGIAASPVASVPPVTLGHGWVHDGDAAFNPATGERRPYDFALDSVPQLAVPQGYKLVPLTLSDERLRYVAECSKQLGPVNARIIKSIHYFLMDSAPVASLPEQTGPSAFLADLQAIDRAMQHMGDTLNEMDVVDAADEDIAAPGFAALAKLLSAAASPSLAPARQQEPSANLTNEQIRSILHKHSRYMGQPDYYSDTEFACLQDVVGFAREVLRESGKSVETAAPGASTEGKQ